MRPFGEEGKWQRHARLLAKLHNCHFKGRATAKDFLWRLGE